MGCLGNKLVDPEIAKLLASLDEKVEDFQETFIKESEEVQKDLDDFTKEKRPEVIKQMKEIHDLKKKNEITKEDLNNREYFVDIIVDIIIDPEGKKIEEEDDEFNEEEDEQAKEEKEKQRMRKKREEVSDERILAYINEEKDITIPVLKRLNEIELFKK